MAVDCISIGKRIRKNRVKRHISQEQLAEMCSLSSVYISYVEHGDRLPSLETVISIANALKVSADELLSGCLDVAQSRLVSNVLELLYETTDEEQAILLKSLNAIKRILQNYNISE